MNSICRAVVFLTLRYLQVAYPGGMCVTPDTATELGPIQLGFSYKGLIPPLECFNGS